MMSWYVFALVDELPAGRPGRGLAGPLVSRKVPGGFAIVERRRDVPPAEFGTLKTHDAVVARLAEAVPAILPVRFGTLLEMEEIEEALQERDDEIADAFATVRARVQFTWRSARVLGTEARSAKAAAMTGVEYLRQAARAANPPPPAAFRRLRRGLRPLITAERYQPATPSLPDSLYHLVDRSCLERYRLLAEKLASASATPALRLSGPWAPFAFTPDLL
jgi:hypothetical protein